MLFAALEAECPRHAKAETLGMGQQQKYQDNAKHRGEQQNDLQRRREQIIDGAEGRYSRAWCALVRDAYYSRKAKRPIQAP